MQTARQRLWTRTGSRAGTTALAGIVALALAGLTLSAQAAAVPHAKASSDHPDSARGHGKNPHKKQRAKQRPMYWGAWIGDQLTGTQPPWDMNAVSRFEDLVDKGLSVLSLSSPFAECSGSCSFFGFPTKAMSDIREYGAIPFFNWSSQSIPADPTDASNMPDFQLSDLNSGAYDSYIRKFAESARSWGYPFFLRFDWEMNGDWFPWGAGVNGNKPGEYVAAWRHVHDIFTSVGATNATWVWCPYTEVRRRFAPLRGLYPGSAYVDWTCMDGFNWGNNTANPHPWRSFAQIFGSTYRTLTQRIAPDKPIILAEMASTGGARAKAHWIHNMFKQLATNFRRIRGLIWFERMDRGIDWPLETSAAATRAFARGIHRPAYRSNSFASATGGPIQPLH